MNIKQLSLALAVFLTGAQWCFASTVNGPAESASKNRLTIRLPSEATVENEKLTLGQFAVVTGEEKLAAKAREIELGRISVPGQKLTIDRSLIRSRLACSGIPDLDPVFLGADSVTIRQRAKVIKGDSFVESASSFLAGSIKEPAIARWEPLREPVDMILSNQPRNAELLPRLVSRGATGQATTEVSVVADGEVLGARQIVFRPKYNIRRAVAVTDVTAGSVLTTANTRIEEVIEDQPEPAGWVPPYGLTAVRNITAGTVIGAGMAKAPQPQVVIERNQTVCIRIDKPGLVVTALGKAMQQGKLDEYIKVRNIDSQRVIMARVNEDGTVEPVF